MTDHLAQLTELLREFPGIGPRQARRLTYWLARRDRQWVESFAQTLTTARKEVSSCSACMRLFPHTGTETVCTICGDPRRDQSLILVVEKDVDLENIERTHTYTGTYFVLGGTATALDKEPEQRIRLKELVRAVRERAQRTPPLRELIFALSATPDGEDTATLITERLAAEFDLLPFRLTTLGRGLSTGTELEYVDTETMKNALRGRI